MDQHQTPSVLEAQQAEAVVRKFWDAFNRAAWNELEDLVLPTFVHHPPGKTLRLSQFIAGGGWVHQGLANYTLTIDALLTSSTEVAIRWTACGRHVGSFFGETPTNREIRVQGMHFHAVSNGRIAEDWEVIDFDGFKDQLRPEATT
jgi:predicted ester cyclase